MTLPFRSRNCISRGLFFIIVGKISSKLSPKPSPPITTTDNLLFPRFVNTSLCPFSKPIPLPKATHLGPKKQLSLFLEFKSSRTLLWSTSNINLSHLRWKMFTHMSCRKSPGRTYSFIKLTLIISISID